MVWASRSSMFRFWVSSDFSDVVGCCKRDEVKEAICISHSQDNQHTLLVYLRWQAHVLQCRRPQVAEAAPRVVSRVQEAVGHGSTGVLQCRRKAARER